MEGVPAESRLSGDGNTFWQQPAHLVQVSQRRSLENAERQMLHKSIKQGAQTEKRKAGGKNAMARCAKGSAGGKAGGGKTRRKQGKMLAG